MAYIGVDINYGNIAKQTGTGDGSDTTPIAALTYTVPSNESILVFLDGVCQVPGTDFTATGTTLTFTTAPALGVAILVMFLGRSLDIGTPGDGTVSLAKMAVNSIDSDQYVDGSIDLAHIATNQIDETLMKDAFVGDFSDVTVTAADAFLYGDATDSGNTKKDTIQGILDLVPSSGWTQGTEVVTTSGTEHDFTSIPAGVRVIQMGFENVSLSGTSSLIVQLGDSGGFETSGYSSASSKVNSSSSVMLSDSGLGYVIIIGSAARNFNGVMTLVNKDAAAFDWSAMHAGRYDSANSVHGGGWSDLSAELNSIRVTTINGSDTFDGGAININYL